MEKEHQNAIESAERDCTPFVMLNNVKGNLVLDLAGYNAQDIKHLIDPSQYYLIARTVNFREVLVQDSNGKEIVYGLGKTLAENMRALWDKLI